VRRWSSCPTAFILLSFVVAARAEPPQTVAETSDYKTTSSHAEVVAFCERLAKESPLIRVGTLGTSSEGRKLPLVILADPPVATAEEAARSKKLVVFAMGNIHAGEVDGKEALLMLMRDLALAKEKPLLKDVVLVFAPIFNADGNEKFATSNRPEQAGPPSVGTRTNAQGLDLNRDFVKLESPEVRSLVRFLSKWDPAVVVDCHTTNGSFHRYTLTYEGGRCPGGDSRVVGFVRDEMLPELGRRMDKTDHFKTYFYGLFSPDRSRWETVPPTPRYGTHYVGLRNRIAILSESYSYAPFKDRVLASRAFVRNIIEYTAENKDRIRKLLDDARTGAAKVEQVALRYKATPLGRPHDLLGYVEEVKDGKRVATAKTKEYPVEYMGGTETTLTAKRPWGYVIPASFANVAEVLQRHGLEVEELREDMELDVEVYKIDKVSRAGLFQKHQPTTLEATLRKEARRVEARSFLVRTANPLGPLTVCLLEPQSIDGLATWNFFDADLKEGKDFPVLRLPDAVPVTRGRIRPLAEDRKLDKPITFELMYGPSPPGFNGAPISVTAWLDDGEHFLQMKEGRLYRVHALTGRCQLFLDPAKLGQSLAALPAMDPRRADRLARSPNLRFNSKKTAVLFDYESDLYLCPLDGGKAIRLTKSPGAKEIVTFSPDGKFVAFIRDGNLHVVEVASQAERALTTDGGGAVLNGKADWVYYEEVFNRNHQAYWWSPDSTRIVFIRFDDAPVSKFNVVDNVPTKQAVEATAYPKAGAANPHVKLGVVSAAGGATRWADLGDYSETSSLIMRAGWRPDSESAYFYVQDRAQTWLDVCTMERDGGEVKRLFRETTKAWVDEPGPPVFLKDGSFLLTLARTGWNHLYHFDKDGKLRKELTSGDWELTTGPFLTHPIECVDEAGGWVYFNAKKDSPIADGLYRVKLDGGAVQRLTPEAGDHHVRVSPRGNLFVDSWSSHAGPTCVQLRKADGSPARTLDTNPVYNREEYRVGKFEMVQIKSADGFVLEGSLLKPPDFDPKRRYPVWMMTYAGPHMPSVHDSWGGGRLHDEMLAQLGFVVLHVDPRSASGKGHCSAWTAYRCLGKHELKDLEAAAKWLGEKEWVDAGRIGLSGGSYGGYITAYALTHSKLFAAGVATAAVTDWRNYDSIYTERYMNTPQENPDGYNASSVVKAAKNLHGKLLLVHGLMDDNVHSQNAVQFVDALQRADKDFEVAIYPRARHGGFAPRYYQRQVIDFMKRALRPETGQKS
jgi:dipeptidyl aminopeptidase/acylaminoacyl peptidase